MLPSWDSIQSTSRASDFLFWLGIWALVVLTVAEVGSHIYGKRSTSLQVRAAETVRLGRLLSPEVLAKLDNQLMVAFIRYFLTMERVVPSRTAISSGDSPSRRESRKEARARGES